MNPPRALLRTIPSALILVSLTVSCTSPPPHEYVAGDDEKFPRIRYADGTVSANDRCPVRRNRMNPRMDYLLVNGRPIGFC